MHVCPSQNPNWKGDIKPILKLLQIRLHVIILTWVIFFFIAHKNTIKHYFFVQTKVTRLSLKSDKLWYFVMAPNEPRLSSSVNR